MRAAAGLDDFLRAPDGRYFMGRRTMVFQHSPTLLGLASWGRPNADDVNEMYRACTIGLRDDAVPHCWLADLRGLEFIDASTFGPSVAYVTANAAVLKKKIIRQAQLRPPGVVGAIISGFSAVARLSYPERVFGAPDEAIGWMGIDPDVGREVVSELNSLRRAALESEPLLARVRELLESHGTVALESAARKLTISPRTLQRELMLAGTSWRSEVRAFQVARARHLLQESQEPLSTVALAVGFSSLQPFVTAFRRATGETPGAFRARVGVSARS